MNRAAEYAENGFLVERGLYSADEASALVDAFMAMHAQGGVEGRYSTPPPDQDHDDMFHHVFKQGDPLLRYPRVMWPHMFLPEARASVLKAGVFDLLEEVLGEEVLSVSSMFYFKPPQARGQAFHQDNYYIRVKPGTCIGVWVACDPSDEANGALQVVPGSQEMEIVCPEISDPANYFAKELVRPPAGLTPELPRMDPGDALIFHGNLIHGSEPNRSPDRFRKSMVCHYMPISSVELGKLDGHAPLLDRHGREHHLGEVAGGGPCGTPHESVLH